MVAYNEKTRAATELTANTAGGTGSFQAFSSTLTQNPVIIIFDNQSNVSVSISDDGTNSWKTFPAGEALVLDLQTNANTSNVFSWKVGTQFYWSSAAGVGNFSIAYVYAG